MTGRIAWVVTLLAGVAVMGCEAGNGPRPRDAARPDATIDSGSDGSVDASRDAGRRDTGPDTGPCEDGLTQCGGECVDTAVDARHCGGCASPCEPPDNGRPTCVDGSCGFDCLPGFVAEGEGCVATPRPVWPPSLSAVTKLRPTLRFRLQDGATDAQVDVCRDPACDSVLTALDATGEEAAVDMGLPDGIVWWRVTADGRTGPTWSFRVRGEPVDADRAWGVRPDFDGNGRGDAVIGAPRVGDDEGRVYVYRADDEGTPSSPTAILRSPDGAGAAFGRALTTAGDVDGDGRADLLIGAPAAAEGVGRAHLFLGRPGGLPETPDQSLDAPDDGGSIFGGAVAGVGDVDGDGYGDVLIGALGEGVTLGRAHLYLGGPEGLETTPAWTAMGTGRFASAVAAAGDANGDGFADVAVGAVGADMMAGEVRIFYGSADGLAEVADVVVAGPDGTGGQFGFSAAGIGDVNADGFADLAVGAPGAESSKGHVHVFYGAAGGYADVPDLTLVGLNSGGGLFGHSIAGLGDADGDGYDDVVIGAFGVNDRTGRVLVHRGDDGGLITTAAGTIPGPFGSGGDFGWSVAGLGDVGGTDGRADLLVGAPRVDSGQGRAYVYRGAAISGVSMTPLRTLIGPSGGAFGRAVARPDR